MPSINIYLPDEVVKFLYSQGTPAIIGGKWIKERYEKEKETKEHHES